MMRKEDGTTIAFTISERGLVKIFPWEDLSICYSVITEGLMKDRVLYEVEDCDGVQGGTLFSEENNTNFIL